MKKLINLAAVILLILLATGCTKTIVPAPGSVASLNVVNVLPTSLPLIPVAYTTEPVTYNSSPPPVAYQKLGGVGAVAYGTNALFVLTSGADNFYTAQKNADTLSNGNGGLKKYMFNSVLNLAAGGAYSLFITGRDTTASDYLFVQDDLPYHAPSDSTAGIRFVNLSTGSNPISVNIQGQATGSEASNLAYKGITNFKNYAATYKISSYVFEFRDASSGALISSYTLSSVNGGSTTSANNVRFKNLTLALIGQPGVTGTYAQKVVQINNY